MEKEVIYLLLFLFEFIFLFFLSKEVTKKLSFLPMTFISLLLLPGVVIHEMAHYLFAIFLFVPTGDMEFVPKKEEGELKLGSVMIGQTDPLRRFLIGVAPIILGIVVIFALFNFLNSEQNLFVKVFLFYVLFTIGNTMFSSKKDMEGALALFILGIILFFLSFILGLRPNSVWFDNQFFVSFSNIVGQVDLFIFFLIILDFCAFFVIKVLRR